MVRQIMLRLTESYFRHRWLYLLPIVLMIAAAAYYAFTIKPDYVARGVVYVKNEPLLSSLTNIQDNTGSYWISPAQAITNEINELLQTMSFVRAIILQTDVEQEMALEPAVISTIVEETRNGFWVYPLGNNQLMVTASNENPQVAYQLVDALIENYRNWQINTQRADSEVAQKFFENLIANYQAELDTKRAEMKAYLLEHPLPVRGDRSEVENIEIARLQGSIDAAAARLTNAQNKMEDAQLAMAQVESNVRQTYILIDAPELPDKPEISTRQIAMNLAAFVLVGIVLSGVAVVGSALLDRTYRFPFDVAQSLELPVLAAIPDITLARKKSLRERLSSRSANREARRAQAGAADRNGNPAQSEGQLAKSS